MLKDDEVASKYYGFYYSSENIAALCYIAGTINHLLNTGEGIGKSYG